jgi:hypothetical protein
MISYNPKFIERYHKSLFYISEIKGLMGDHDYFSMFNYEGDKLKRIFNHLMAHNVNFDTNVDNYLIAKLEIDNQDDVNFLQRFQRYLNGGHKGTKNTLMNRKYKSNTHQDDDEAVQSSSK